MGSLEFCEAIHPLLTSPQPDLKLGIMDDVTLSGDLNTVEKDVNTIQNAALETGLHLNPTKCEIIPDNCTIIPNTDAFHNFVRVRRTELTLPGAHVVQGKAQDEAVMHKT